MADGDMPSRRQAFDAAQAAAAATSDSWAARRESRDEKACGHSDARVFHI